MNTPRDDQKKCISKLEKHHIVRIFAALYFCEFREKIRENIIMNMLFLYISTVITYLVHEKLNVKILF